MSAPIDTLVRYGSEFQTKCVVALLTDRGFVEQALDVCQPIFFESEANKWIVDRIFWYFNKYKALPTILVLKREADKVDHNDVLKIAAIEQLKNVFHVQKANPDDLKYVQTELLTFCKNQAIKQAVLKSADLLATAQYDQIKSIIDKAIHAGAERNIGHIWDENLEERITQVTRNVVITPWECLNKLLDGGLGGGELGCVVAPSGIGKSWLLTAIGAAAVQAGKTVAHYTFELSQTYVGLRYDTVYTKIESKLIRDNVELVKEKIKNIPGKLFIKYFPTRMVTINAIHAHIQQLTRLGHKPDLIIIDYADLMRSIDKANARHEELGFIYEEIRGMAGELNVPVWTASQSQRSSLQDDIVEADKIAGAYGKVMVCDFILSASRKVGDKITKTARIHVIKNRLGADGMTFPAEMDLEHGVINVWDENTPQGAAIKAKIASGEGVLKQLLAKKMIDMKKKSSEPEHGSDL